jgi:hypothetical protein
MADFLDEVLETQPEAVEPAPVEPEPVAEPKEPQQEPEKPAEPAPQSERPEQGMVPFGVMLDERDKRKAAEARIREFEQSQQQVEKPSIPDPFDDPQGYAAYNARQLDERTMQVTFNISERFARQANGDDAVDEAIKWATDKSAKDPIFAASYMREQDPIGYIVQQHKHDALLADIGGNVDDWFTREATKRGYVMPSATDPVAAPAAAVQQPAARPAPPRSIASDVAPVSAPTAKDDKEGFLAAFK